MPTPEAISEVDVLVERVGQMWSHFSDIEIYQIQKKLALLLRGSDIETTIRIHNCAGALYIRQGQYQKAMERLSAGLGLAQQQGNIACQCLFLSNMASLHGASGNYENSLSLFLQVADLKGEDAWQDTFLLGGLIIALCGTGRWVEAEAIWEKAIEGIGKAQPKHFYWLACAAAAMERYELAVDMLGQLLKVRYGDDGLTPLELIKKHEDTLALTNALLDAIAYMEGHQDQQTEIEAHPADASQENAQLQHKVMEAWAPVRARATSAIENLHGH